MTTANESLTPGERQFLEHQREAERQGIPLTQYYRSKGLSVYTLYNVRSRLIKKGMLQSQRGKTPKRQGTGESGQGRFVAVQVAAAAPASAGRACRLKAPNGWVIECDGLPDLSWVTGLMEVRP